MAGWPIPVPEASDPGRQEGGSRSSAPEGGPAAGDAGEDARAAGGEALGFLSMLRLLERAAPDRPRIGRGRRLSEETVEIFQPAFLAFPEGEVFAFEDRKGTPRLSTAVMGYFGPQGPLPLHISEELVRQRAKASPAAGSSFEHFANLLGGRFLQLFFRAWSDARAIGQYDHPGDDRFRDYIASLAGIGTPALAGRAAALDLDRHVLPRAGLVAGRLCSPVRLCQLLAAATGLAVEIEEHVPFWLTFEPEDRNCLGRKNAGLGLDCWLGGQLSDANEKIRLRVACQDIGSYADLLPGRPLFVEIRNLVDLTLGRSFEVDILLCLPAREAPRLRLDGRQALGLTSWLGDPCQRADEGWRCDASFSLWRRQPAPDPHARPGVA